MRRPRPRRLLETDGEPGGRRRHEGRRLTRLYWLDRSCSEFSQSSRSSRTSSSFARAPAGAGAAGRVVVLALRRRGCRFRLIGHGVVPPPRRCLHRHLVLPAAGDGTASGVGRGPRRFRDRVRRLLPAARSTQLVPRQSHGGSTTAASAASAIALDRRRVDLGDRRQTLRRSARAVGSASAQTVRRLDRFAAVVGVGSVHDSSGAAAQAWLLESPRLEGGHLGRRSPSPVPRPGTASSASSAANGSSPVAGMSGSSNTGGVSPRTTLSTCGGAAGVPRAATSVSKSNGAVAPPGAAAPRPGRPPAPAASDRRPTAAPGAPPRRSAPLRR